MIEFMNLAADYPCLSLLLLPITFIAEVTPSCEHDDLTAVMLRVLKQEWEVKIVFYIQN